VVLPQRWWRVKERVARPFTSVTTVIIRAGCARRVLGRGCSLGHGGRQSRSQRTALTQFGPGIVSESPAFHGKIEASHVGFRLIEFAADAPLFPGLCVERSRSSGGGA